MLGHNTLTYLLDYIFLNHSNSNLGSLFYTALRRKKFYMIGSWSPNIWILPVEGKNPNLLSQFFAAKLSDPEFEIVAETVMDSRAVQTKVFRKMEYTMKLTVNNQTYFASASNKKAAKTAVAEEAWNIIRTGTM